MRLWWVVLAWLPIVASADTEVRHSIRIAPFIVDNGRAVLPGEEPAVLYAEGKPEIPVVRQFLDGDLEIRVFPSGETSVLRSATELLPVQPPIPRLPGRTAVWTKDEAAYRSTDFYPAISHTIEKVGSINGVPRWLLTLHPLRYRASDGAIEWRPAFEVRVSRKSAPMPPPRIPVLALVVAKRFESSPALAALEVSKKALGYRVDRIASGSPQEIRLALRKLYATVGLELRHVLLVGDHPDVPGYVTPLVSGVSDHYYRCLDTVDYEADIGTPDVQVGRLAVETESELQTVVGKITRHEKLEYADKSWFKRMSNLATDDPSETNWKMAEGTLEYAVETYLVKAGITGTFPRDPTLGGDKLYAISHKAKGSDVFDAVNQGRSLVNYQGHGGPTEWNGPQFTREDVRRLTPREALPFVVSMACYTGKFTEDSFAEAWLRHPKGGLAFWGSMDVLYWSQADDLIGRAQYDAMYKLGVRQLGTIVHHSLAEGWKFLGGSGNSKYYWETHVILGDPSLRFLEPSPKVIPR